MTEAGRWDGGRADERWEALDEALVELRGCRSAEDLERCACALARRACGATEAALGAPWGDRWWTWCQDGPNEEPRSEGTGEAPGEYCRRVALPVPGASTGWQLELVVPDEAWDELGVEVAGWFAASLGRVMASAAVLQRVEEQRFVLARVASAVTSGPERAVELADGSVQDGARMTVGANAVGDPASSVEGRLSPRQREVLDLVVRGLSNAEIAEHLVVSVPTVKSHVRAVLQACGAVNRSEAITRLVRGHVAPQ